MEKESLNEGYLKILFILIGSLTISIIISVFFPHISKEHKMTDYIERNYPDLNVNNLEYFQIDSEFINLEYPSIFAGKIKKPELVDLYYYSIEKEGIDSNFKGAFIVFDSTFYPCTAIPKNLFESVDGSIQFKMKNFVYKKDAKMREKKIKMIFEPASIYN